MILSQPNHCMPRMETQLSAIIPWWWLSLVWTLSLSWSVLNLIIPWVRSKSTPCIPRYWHDYQDLRNQQTIYLLYDSRQVFLFCSVNLSPYSVLSTLRQDSQRKKDSLTISSGNSFDFATDVQRSFLSYHGAQTQRWKVHLFVWSVFFSILFVVNMIVFLFFIWLVTADRINE